MALELFMVILIVRDMPASVGFYRALGLDLPAGSEEQPAVEVKMAGMSLLLTTRPRGFDEHYGERADLPTGATGSYPQVLEFNLTERSAVEAMYAKLTSLGYRAYRAPYETSFGPLFAMVYDPDGNMVLLSA
jgi:catechol 2,3-dioxygenase-like lactoylglutathione lyase family enzyme